MESIVAGFTTLVFGDVDSNMLPFSSYGADGTMTPYVKEFDTTDDIRSDMYDDMQNGYECNWREFAERHHIKVFKIGENYRKDNVFSFMILDDEDELVKSGEFNNPKSEWDGYGVIKNFGVLTLKDGTETCRAQKGDIDLKFMRKKLYDEAIKNIRFFRKLLVESDLLDGFIRDGNMPYKTVWEKQNDIYSSDDDSVWMTEYGRKVSRMIAPYSKFDGDHFQMFQDVRMNPEKWRDGLVIGDDNFAYEQSRNIVSCYAMVFNKNWMDRSKNSDYQINSMKNHLFDTISDDTFVTLLDTHG